MNKLVLLSSIFLICIGIGVSRVKYEVVFLKNQLKSVNTQIEKISDDLKVYGAEWSYLNDPKRLQALSEKYLKNMRPTENSQILNYKEIVNSELSRNIKDSLGDLLGNALGEED